MPAPKQHKHRARQRCTGKAQDAHLDKGKARSTHAEAYNMGRTGKRGHTNKHQCCAPTQQRKDHRHKHKDHNIKNEPPRRQEPGFHLGKFACPRFLTRMSSSTHQAKIGLTGCAKRKQWADPLGNTTKHWSHCPNVCHQQSN